MSTVVWMTGLSGSGKSTIAQKVRFGIMNSVIIDGDIVREGLCSDLGFSIEDRYENIRRVAHIVKILSDNGLSPIIPAITPTNDMRNMARDIIGDRFNLVWVRCPLEVCEDRDVKGLYKKARAGELKQFTGIDSPFEEPDTDIICDTDKFELSYCARHILRGLNKHGFGCDLTVRRDQLN